MRILEPALSESLWENSQRPSCQMSDFNATNGSRSRLTLLSNRNARSRNSHSQSASRFPPPTCGFAVITISSTRLSFRQRVQLRRRNTGTPLLLLSNDRMQTPEWVELLCSTWDSLVWSNQSTFPAVQSLLLVQRSDFWYLFLVPKRRVIWVCTYPVFSLYLSHYIMGI